MSKSNSEIRILVTGGAGFIGSHLTDKLLADGYKVTVLDNLSNGNTENLQHALTFDRFTFIEGDILNKSVCENVLLDIDYVFHLACLGVRNSIHNPFDNHRVNAEGTLNVLLAARHSRVKHFFYISTSEVYGRTTAFPITESADTNPLTVYGASKLAGEHYTKAFFECYNLPVTVLRIFNNYGPRAHFEGDAGEIIPRSIVKILYDEAPVLFGDGSITRDFYFVKDTAAALTSLLEIAAGSDAHKILGKTLNIGTGVELTMKSLLENLLVAMDREELGVNYLPDRPADVPRLWVDASSFRQLTGHLAAHSFDEGINETISYYVAKIKERNLLAEVEEINWIK